MISQYFIRGRASFLLLQSLALFSLGFNQAFAREAKPAVIFTSPCSCEGAHGESRWKSKTDHAEPPVTPLDIHPLTPSEMYDWPGPGVPITHRQDRIGQEQRWYALTGRVDEIRVEEDGDLHVVLSNVDGGKPGRIVVEFPLEAQWCAMRTLLFSWTDAAFPFDTRRGVKLAIKAPHIIKVIGKAFYDVDHSGRDTRNNRRNYDQSEAVWEIHPVMKLESSGGNQIATAALSATPLPKIAAAAPTQTATPAVSQFATILSPTPITIPYGQVMLTKGMRLEVVSRSGSSVTVRYMNNNYTIPLSATDLQP